LGRSGGRVSPGALLAGPRGSDIRRQPHGPPADHRPCRQGLDLLRIRRGGDLNGDGRTDFFVAERGGIDINKGVTREVTADVRVTLRTGQALEAKRLKPRTRALADFAAMSFRSQ